LTASALKPPAATTWNTSLVLSSLPAKIVPFAGRDDSTKLVFQVVAAGGFKADAVKVEPEIEATPSSQSIEKLNASFTESPYLLPANHKQEMDKQVRRLSERRIQLLNGLT
jgi:hypothetical protein